MSAIEGWGSGGLPGSYQLDVDQILCILDVLVQGLESVVRIVIVHEIGLMSGWVGKKVSKSLDRHA